jgi:hypothetical protein
MDQVAEDRQGAGVRVLERERDGIANAETHAEVGGSNDTHGVLAAAGRSLCHITESSPPSPERTLSIV